MMGENDAGGLERSGVGFATTHWSLVEQARGGDAAARREALDRLLRAYWPAVYSYLRRDGLKREEAGEVTQAFFAEVVVQREVFESAEAERGRLRSFLLTGLKRYLIDRHRRAAARPACTPLDPAQLEREDSLIGQGALGAAAPEDLFEKRWSLVLVEEAVRRSERYFVEQGKGAHWEAFEARVLRPTLGAGHTPGLREINGELGFATAAGAASAVQVVKRHVLSALREVVAETVEGGEEAEREFLRVVGMLA